MPDGNGQGVQLACSNCHEQWWEVKKESINTNHSQQKVAVPDQPFRNLTDISLLYQKQSANYAYQESPRESQTTFVSRSEDRMFAQPQNVSKNLLEQKKWNNLTKIGIWSFIIFIGIVTAALVAMRFNLPSLTQSSHYNQSAPGDINIENIQFDVTALDDQHQRISVLGNVKNPGPLAVPLKNIQLTAWGSCLPGQNPNEQGLCQIRVWPYKWKQDLLQPGEQLTFKSVAKIPANLHVDQVHVDVATN